MYKLDMRTMERVCVWQDETLRPASVKPHRDGRLIISCLSGSRSGRIVVARPDGSTERTLAEGRDVDDVVFDADGNMYYTHFTGTVYNPVGAIYRVTRISSMRKFSYPTSARQTESAFLLITACSG